MARSREDLEALLEEILDNQVTQKEAFDEFREEVLEKLDNLNLSNEGFTTFDA